MPATIGDCHSFSTGRIPGAPGLRFLGRDPGAPGITSGWAGSRLRRTRARCDGAAWCPWCLGGGISIPTRAPAPGMGPLWL